MASIDDTQQIHLYATCEFLVLSFHHPLKMPFLIGRHWYASIYIIRRSVTRQRNFHHIYKADAKGANMAALFFTITLILLIIYLNIRSCYLSFSPYITNFSAADLYIILIAFVDYREGYWYDIILR